jgi:hypothetical protein
MDSHLKTGQKAIAYARLFPETEEKEGRTFTMFHNGFVVLKDFVLAKD